MIASSQNRRRLNRGLRTERGLNIPLFSPLPRSLLQQSHRIELSREAIRLARSIHALVPEDAEVAGLLALMLLTDARRVARVGPDDQLIPLTKQDRSLWDRAQISEGTRLLTHCLSKGSIGPYQLQAAIAAIHDEAARSEDTDWPQILALYDLLSRMSDNPMVMLNHAVAAGMVHGPKEGVALLSTLDSGPRLAGHHRLYAVRAHLLEMAGDHEGAVSHYHIAAARTSSLPERNYLSTRAAQLSEAQLTESFHPLANVDSCSSLR